MEEMLNKKEKTAAQKEEEENQQKRLFVLIVGQKRRKTTLSAVPAGKSYEKKMGLFTVFFADVLVYTAFFVYNKYAVRFIESGF
ncbi:MAG: hypothetical protein V8Q36_10105 [Anaerotignum sp.]